MKKSLLHLLTISLLMIVSDSWSQRIIPLDFTIKEPSNGKFVPYQGQFVLSLIITNASANETLQTGDTILYTFTGSTNLNGIILHSPIPPGQSFTFDSLNVFTNSNTTADNIQDAFCVQVYGSDDALQNGGSWSNPNYATSICANVTMGGYNGSNECDDSYATINTSTCSNYRSPSGKYTWNTSGTYTDTIPNAGGCDSIITINLTVGNVDVSVTQNNEKLKANATGVQYQWVNCDQNYKLIPGATGQEYEATENGKYAVIITEGSCTDTSDCYTVSGLSMNNAVMDHGISIYPNPTSGALNLKLDFEGNKSIRIVNTLGVEVWKGNTSAKVLTLNLDHEAEGNYLIIIHSELGSVTKRITLKK